MNSASSDRSGRPGTIPASFSAEFSSVANPVVPGKKTPMPPTSVPCLNSGMPPGSVPIPRACAPGRIPETNPYDSGAASVWPFGRNAGSTLKRPGSRTSSAVPLIRSGPGWTRLSRLVCSMENRSTAGVNGTRGGKCAFSPIGATKPGPRRVEFASVMFGFDSTSRWVMVDWLMNWTVRDVSGAALLANSAAVRASASAPSTAKVSAAASPVIAGATPALDAHAQDVAAPVDDGDDRVVAGRGRRRPPEQLAHLGRRQGRIPPRGPRLPSAPRPGASLPPSTRDLPTARHPGESRGRLASGPIAP